MNQDRLYFEISLGIQLILCWLMLGAIPAYPQEGSCHEASRFAQAFEVHERQRVADQSFPDLYIHVYYL